MTNDTVFIGGGGLKTLNDQIHENDRRLADQALALAKGELSLAKTEKKLLESELLLHQKRTAQLTAEIESRPVRGGESTESRARGNSNRSRQPGRHARTGVERVGDSLQVWCLLRHIRRRSGVP